VELELGCSNGCNGTAVITPGSGGGARPRAVAAAARRPVARIRFKVKAGPARTIRLKVSAKARRALKRAGGGRITITLKPKSGPAARTTLKLTLRR
jgi:hypothetical protein